MTNCGCYSACAKPAVLQGQETEHRADAPFRASKQDRACIDSSGRLERLAAIESVEKKDPKTYQLIGAGAKEHAKTGFSDLSAFAYLWHAQLGEDSRVHFARVGKEEIQAKG